MIKVIIVEDEPKSQKLIAAFLEEYNPEAELCGVAGNVQDAVKLIHKVSPDIVLLDVGLPGLNGLLLPGFFENRDFEIIFITGNKEYAVNAFELSAADYLLKPIDPERLKIAIHKATAIRRSKLAESLHPHSGEIPAQDSFSRLIVPNTEGYIFIDWDDIILIKAEGTYSNIILSGKEKVMATKNLGYFEAALPKNLFFKPHRSYIVHIRKIKSYNRQDGGQILLNNGHAIPIVRNKLEELLTLLQIKHE